MTNDTQNSLTDFDMCLALAQKAINSQLTAAWESWIARSEFSITGEMKDFALVKIFPINKKNGKPSQYGLEAEFAPLTVSFYVPSGKLGQVEVTLHLQSGTVTYFDEEEEEKGSYDFKNWSVSFLTDLDKKPCDLKMLEQIDPSVRGSAEEVIKQSGLPDSVFSIEYLFMKFTQVNLLLSDNKNIHIPDDVPKAVRTKALTSLNDLLQGGAGDFMLGTVVRRSKEKSKKPILPTFALTDFIFNIKADSVPEASTLSYLGMFSKRSLPQGKELDSARIKLADNWVRPEMLDGTKGSIAGIMAISQHTFMDRHLIPLFNDALKEIFLDPQKNDSTLTWKYVFDPKNSVNGDYDQKSKDIVVREYQIECTGEINISIKKGDCKLKVDGFAQSSISYHSYFKSNWWEYFIPVYGVWKAIWELGNGIANKVQEKGFHCDASLILEGRQDIEGHFEFIDEYFQLSETDSTLHFQVKAELAPPNVSNWIKDVRITKNEVTGTASWTDDTWFGDNIARPIFKLFKLNSGDTPNEILEELNKGLTERLKAMLQENLDKIQFNFKNQSFIPPGGGVFTFQNLRFSDAGDLLFDVIYKAP